MSNKINNRDITPTKHHNYCIKSEELLYKLSDAGLLNDLCGVSKNREDKAKNVWFFRPTKDVTDIVKQHSENEKNQLTYQ